MWIKQGRIFHLGDSPNRSTHCQVPTPYIMDDRIRVYYSCRKNGVSFVGFFDLAPDLKTIMQAPEKPVMEHGEPGMFDADGVMPSCVIHNNKELLMYYIGWSELRNTARYQNEIGIAQSFNNGESFEPIYNGPIMGRTKDEPGLAVMPVVLRQNWLRMWYQSGTGWYKIGEQYEPTYNINYAQSFDGVTWRRFDTPCFHAEPLEAISRPTVVYDKGIYKMWYCYRWSNDYRGGPGSYRMGYAYSNNSINFIRDDMNCGIDMGKAGDFDSHMQCYPYVIEYKGKLLMFYNGNGFGQTGIGLAIWA